MARRVGDTPRPPGPHPPVVRPAFTLRCEYCREPNRGPGQRHQRIADGSGSGGERGVKTWYRCWNCYTVEQGRRKATTFAVIREDRLRDLRTARETT